MRLPSPVFYSCLFSVLVAGTVCAPAQGLPGTPAEASAERDPRAVRSFSIPASDATASLTVFSAQSGSALVYAVEQVRGIRTNRIEGRFPPREALERLVAHTALIVVEDSRTGALMLKRPPPQKNTTGAIAPSPGNSASASLSPKNAARSSGWLSALLLALPLAEAQTAPATPAPDTDTAVMLSPFEVTDTTRGYYGSNTMSGTRLNSKIEDLASSITVVTKEQMMDFALLDINDIFLYEAGTESADTFTDFSIDRNGSPVDNTSLDPNNANRVRGIGAANISFGNFETSGRVPIDPIAIDGVEISRGPNSSVFGLGNAAGTVNMIPASANVQRDRSTLSFRADSYDGYRSSIDLNRVLKQDKLALRVSAVAQHQGYVRKPSGIDTRRLNAMVRFHPFKNTTFNASHSYYGMHGTRVNTVMPRDAITGWRNAGSPTWDPVTATAKINGVPVPGKWTATSLPPYFSNSDFRTLSTLFIGRGGDIGFWSPSRTTSTPNPNTPNQDVFLVNPVPEPIRQVQPLFSGDPSVSSKAVYDYTSVNLAAMNSYRERALTSQVQLEQIVLNTLRHLFALQAGWFREDSHRESTELAGRAGGGGATGLLYVDVNERMIDGRPNPYFFQPFLGYYRLAWDRDVPSERQTSRLQAVYRLDLRQEKSPLRWLGMHQLSGYGEYKRVRSRETVYQDQLVSTHFWYPRPATSTRPAALPAAPAIATLFERFYVGDAHGQNVDFAPEHFAYGTNPYTWGNGVTGSFVTEPAELGKGFNRTNGYSKDVYRNKGAVLQSTLLKNRVVTTFGLRRDYSIEQAPAGRLYTNGPEGVGVADDTLHILNPKKIHNSGTTRTSGVVVKAFRWLNLHYNQSDSFRPEDQIYQNLHLETLPNPHGEGQDYGFSLNLFDGKLVARINKYSTIQYDSRDGSTRTLAQRVRRIDFPTPNGALPGLTVQARGWITAAAAGQGLALTEDQIVQRISDIAKLDVDYFTRNESINTQNNNIWAVADVESKGFEFELNFNPNQFWTTKFNLTQTQSIDLRISKDTEDWINERLPVWESVIDPEINRPWFTERYGGTQSTKEFLQEAVLEPLRIATATEGKSRPQIRKYRANLATSYRLAGLFQDKLLSRFTVGAALRWEDKGAIGYYGVESLPAVITHLDPTRPIYEKARLYADAFVAYRTRLFRDRVGATFQLNVRNLQEDGRLQAISAYPDGTPNGYRIIDPRQFILTVTFDL